MEKIAVVAVPFIRSYYHYLFMVETIESIRRNRTALSLDLIAVINHLEGEDEAKQWIESNFDYYHYNDQNIVSRAWNKGIEAGFARGATYCLVINLDMIFHPHFIENLVAFAKRYPDLIAWSGQPWLNQSTLENAPLEGEPTRGLEFCAFMVDQRLSQIVGPFDEAFKPAYHEDADMAYRIARKGLETRRTPSAPFFHFENVTYQTAIVQKDEAYIRKFTSLVEATQKIYEAKWGGPPGQERYLFPYDKAEE